MSEFYEYGGSGARCLRSSPLSALVGLILVLLGGATFGAGAIYARTNLILLTEANHLLPYVDYAVFAVVGATGLFAIIAFIVCAVSSGWNGKRCFEGSRKAFCGRCLNTTLLICLIFGIIFWTLLAALLAFPVTSMSLLLYRDIGPTRIFSRSRMGAEVTARPLRVSRQTSVDSDGQELLGNLPPYVQPRPPVQPIGLSVPEEHLRTLDRSPSPIPNPHDLILNFFKCSALAVDLSYYGLYDNTGYPLAITSMNLNFRIRNTLIFSSISFVGSLLILIGYLLILVCVAMNSAKLREARYYDPSESGDEIIRLHQ